MFLRRSEPVLLTEEGIEGLCPSLNRPVVDIDHLPVGPARSAIALYRDPAGQLGLFVTVRSEDSGVVTVFEFEGELTSTPHRALDVGLSFAESMGFLFDEDMLGSGDPGRHRRALETWCELTGDEPPGPAQVAPAALENLPPAGPASGDLMLDDLVEAIDGDLDDLDDLSLDPVAPAALDEPVAPAPPAASAAPPQPDPPQGAVLSKFRRTAAEPAPANADADGDSGSGAQLARIPILKRRRTAADAPESPPLLHRLLARF